MMRSLLFLIFIACFYACAINNHQQKRPINSTSGSILSYYNKIEFDTLHVFSTTNIDDSTFKYKGVLLDSVQLSMFPENLNFTYEPNQPVYACYKFSIDKNSTGLITRVYSEYVSSKIKLFIYDKSRDSVYYYKDLAENFGDAGDVFLQASCLYKSVNKQLSCLTKESVFYYNEVDNPADTSVERSVSYKLSDVLNPDTIRVIDEKLIRHFNSKIFSRDY